MEREIVGKRPTFRPNKKSTNFYRALVLIGLILGILWLFVGYLRGQYISPFQPTPTPTRVAESYFMEAQAYFDAGKLDDPRKNANGTPSPAITDAIGAYKAALERDPGNAIAWGELARIQTYSSNMLRNDTDRLEREKEAVQSADKAVQLAPDDSSAHAIRAFALDWQASNSLVSAADSQELLVEAEREASRAYQLDPANALALAYYAEILSDQQKWAQAEKYAAQAVSLDPNSMDTHRVYGYVLETLGQYNSAIQQYQKATEINPNMTFLYVRIGQNYREGIKNPIRALEFFDRAAKINEQLGVENPLPYLEIAKTYIQQGQFFIASINAQKALSFDPGNAHTYGQLGIIYIRARNYEGSMPLLKCSVLGCTATENEMGKVAVEGLPLTSVSVAYYYVEYGTVLAFLSRANDDYCPQAMPVLEQVRQAYPADPILQGIVQDSEGICHRLEGGGLTATAVSAVSATPTPGKNGVRATRTPRPTSTPRAVLKRTATATLTETPAP